MTIPKMRVLGYRVLIQLDHLTAEGVEIPDTVKALREEGTVVVVGDGTLPAQFGGRILPIPFQVGERVWCSNFGGQYKIIGNEEYILHSVDDVFAVLPEPSRLITR